MIAQKDTEINELHARLIQLSGDSQSSNTELAKQLAEMRTECRWAKEGRAAAEQREELAKKEIKALRSIEERVSCPLSPYYTAAHDRDPAAPERPAPTRQSESDSSSVCWTHTRHRWRRWIVT